MRGDFYTNPLQEILSLVNRPSAPLLFGWFGMAAAISAGCIAAIAIGPRFDEDLALARPSMPILGFTLGLVALGLFALLLIPLIGHSRALSRGATRRLLATIALVGLLWRLALLASVPVLEIDYNRYLWDGGVTANGFNPYAVAPGQVSARGYDDALLALSQRAYPVFDHISYRNLKTIYPPVAQAAFAVAHIIEPWSLTAWRTVCIAADVATFALLVALLAAVGRSPLWVALYWWNPLVLKEVVNSAHMEAILMPLVLGALLLSVRGRHLAATTTLALAIGTKLWPVLLVPLILRPLYVAPPSLLAATAILTAMIGAFCVPIWLGGLDPTSGFVAFASDWNTNSALFPALRAGVASLAGLGAADQPWAGTLVRFSLAMMLAAIAVATAWRPIRSSADLVSRAYLVTTALLVSSPAQFPWYALWVLPLAVLHPSRAWHLAAAILPLYYSAFHWRTIGQAAVFDDYVVWIIWIPVWLMLARDATSPPRDDAFPSKADTSV